MRRKVSGKGSSETRGLIVTSCLSVLQAGSEDDQTCQPQYDSHIVSYSGQVDLETVPILRVPHEAAMRAIRPSSLNDQRQVTSQEDQS